MGAPVRVPATLPKPWRGQLETGAPTEGSDCGVLSFTYQVQGASMNRITPPALGMSWPAWVKAVRHAMGRTTGATSTVDWYRAWRSSWLRELFNGAGLAPPKVQRLHGSSWDTMKRHLRAGRYIALCVNYGVLRRQAGALDVPVGSDTFSGGHALVLVGLRAADQLVYTNDLDPLFDGTPAKVPDGPVVARLAAFKAPAGQFGKHPHGFGKVEAISVATAAPLPEAELDMDHELRVLEDQLEAALEQVGRLRRAA